jgi:hypothetical protein
MIDLARPLEKYDDNYVLYGKGGKINQHPGNIRLCQDNKCNCSNENKKIEAEELLETVTRMGCHRFLDIGPGGKWYPVVSSAPGKKVKQILRDFRNTRS